MHILRWAASSSFNTTLVQLKVPTTHRFSVCRRSFNTTLVQLKGGAWWSKKRFGCTFQYHTGPIKRISRSSSRWSLSRFNTTLVQLKGNCGKFWWSNDPMFQYHTGPIKRATLCPRLSWKPTGFNTTLVQLKGAKDLANNWTNVVSIPHWSN